MKTTSLVTVLVSFLAFSCSANIIDIDKRMPTDKELVGSWSCKTVYKDLNVGIVDLITLKLDGKMVDESYIFDNSLTARINHKVDDYFSALHKYLTISTGSWKLNGRHLTYSLKFNRAIRLIYPDLFAEMQQSEFLKDYETKLFNIYSSNKGVEQFELEFTGFIKNGYVTTQKLENNSYKSYCIKKDKAGAEFNQRLEMYKKIATSSHF